MTKIEPARFLDKKSQPHTFTLVVLASISAMAMNIFLPSLPSMANHFNTSTATLGLTVGIYLAASAIIGILSDQYQIYMGEDQSSLFHLQFSLFLPFGAFTHLLFFGF